MKIVVLSTDNESYMLQWWFPHTAKKFDFGVIVDFNNDNPDDPTYELYKKHVPHWRYLKIKQHEVNNFVWDVIINKIENDVQQEFPGSWITTLNATEFLIGNLNVLDNRDARVKPVLIPCHLMNDKVENEFVEPDPNIPLLEQRHHGVHYANDMPHPHAGHSFKVFNEQKPENVILNTRWMRSIHNYPIDYLATSYYGVGRHFWNMNFVIHDLAICHMNLSPYTETFIYRKMNIQRRLTENDRQADRGIHHRTDKVKISCRKKFYDQLTVDLKPEIDKLESL